MPDSQPNILFLFSDEHSFRCFSHLSDDVGEPVSTPTFDDLANTSANFTQSYTAMPLCTPSRLCVLTGRNVRGAGAWSNGHHIKPELTTLPETLGAAGYDTCLVGKMHLGGSKQFGGFDARPYGDLTGQTGHQDDPPTPGMGNGMGMRSRTRDAGVTGIRESQHQERNVIDESIAWLREHRASSDNPWFLTSSFSRPHFPLTAPRRHFERYWQDGPTDRLTEPKVGHEGDTTDHPLTEGAIAGFRTDEIDEQERQRARAAYFACVDYLDELLGDFLSTLEREGFLENTIVVYATDHGELAGEHGIWWKHTWHEAAARVPLFIQLPGHRSGELTTSEIQTPTSLIDIYPTLAEFAGADAPDDLDGESLAEATTTGEEPTRSPVFTDNLVPRWGEGTEFRAVRDGEYKYVAFRDAPELLFDLSEDPLEQHNLAPSASGRDREALDRLRELVNETMDFDAAEEERKRDQQQLEEDYPLSIPEGTRNMYHMPDGTVVDADSPLYRPHVLTERPDVAFDDYPGSTDDT